MCPAGTFISVNELTSEAHAEVESCKLCRFATWSAKGATSCTLCKAGFYLKEDSRTLAARDRRIERDLYSEYPHFEKSVLLHSIFYIAPMHNSIFRCKSCAAGQYSFENSTLCEKCPPGRFSTIFNATQQNVCAVCPKGQFADEWGLTYCTKCPYGTMLQDDGAVQTHHDSINDCEFCSLNQFGNKTGADKCLACLNVSVPHNQTIYGNLTSLITLPAYFPSRKNIDPQSLTTSYNVPTYKNDHTYQIQFLHLTLKLGP